MRSPRGFSASEHASLAADTGTPLAYWYGYDQPGQQAGAWTRLTSLTCGPLWCGDLMVTGATSTPGDLGRATTPGTGFGVILANCQAATITACTALGHALADAYTGVTLPDGTWGNLIFTTTTSGPAA